MLEQLRREMIEAFRIYANKDTERRDAEWMCYIKCRETYLREDAHVNNYLYRPLKPVALTIGGH